VTVIKEEKEKIMISSPAEEEEHTIELLTQWEMELEILEDWLNNLGPEGGFQETVMLDGEEYQPEEQLEEAGVEPTQEELAGVSLSEEIVEQQFSEETAELESATEWQAKATGYEDIMRDQVDLPFDQHKEMQLSKLHEGIQLVDQLEDIIEIRRLMLRSSQEAINRRNMNIGGPARAAGKQQHQQQHIRGAGGQLQGKVWDPGGFQH
jgi:hypothetical protein